MMRFVLALLPWAIWGGCRFDTAPLGGLPCDPAHVCPPGQECQSGECIPKECSVPSDCGGPYLFRCEDGRCEAVRCASMEECGPNFVCTPGNYCISASCIPSQEGPPESSSCSDGVDNDCDGRIDGMDPDCWRCSEDRDCDDGKRCTGEERCVETRCVDGNPVICPQPLLQCQVAVCEEAGAGSYACVLRNASDGTPCEDGNACTEGDSCYGGVCQGAPKDCSDGIGCTQDECGAPDGICTHEPKDEGCAGGEVCDPSCFSSLSGCGLVPEFLHVACQAPARVGSVVPCTIDLAGTLGQAACLSCMAHSSVTPIFSSDFSDASGCSLDGWGVAPSSPCTASTSWWCAEDMPSSPAVQIDKALCSGKTLVLTRVVDTSGFDRVVLCFDTADRGATGGNDSIEVAYTTVLGAEPIRIFRDVDGPLPSIDNTWFRYCIGLPPDAAEKPTLLLQITLHSNDDGQRILIDNVTLFGVKQACEKRKDVFVSRFEGCVTSGWTLSGSPLCPGMWGEAIEANGQSFTLERTVDMSALGGHLVLSFELMESGTGKDDSFTVAVNGDGTWTTVFAQNGSLRTDVGRTMFEVWLTEVYPALRRASEVRLRFSAVSSGNNRRIAVDNVALYSVQGMCDASGAVQISPPSEMGSGVYEFGLQTDMPGPLDVTCSWGSHKLVVGSECVPFVL